MEGPTSSLGVLPWHSLCPGSTAALALLIYFPAPVPAEVQPPDESLHPVGWGGMVQGCKALALPRGWMLAPCRM